MSKYYRVTKDNFLWKEGAILQEFTTNYGHQGYKAIEDIWDVVPEFTDQEYITAHIMEHKEVSQYFERVYSATVSGKLFKTKDQLLDLYQTAFKA